MSGPWEQFAKQPAAEGPWTQYAKPEKSKLESAVDLAKTAIGLTPVGGVLKAMNAYDGLSYDAGGKVTDMAAPHMPAEAAAGLGFATNLGMQAIPTVLSGIPAKAAAPIMQAGGRSLMQSSLKPGVNELRNGKAARAIETMLKEGYNVTPGGVSAMKMQIAALGDEITEAVKGSTAMINKNAVASRLQETLKQFEKQVTPGADTAAIEKAWTEFLKHPLLVGKSEMPVQLANEMKKGTYRQIGEKGFGELKSAEKEAQKSLARGLKEEVASAVPAIGPLNATEGALINAAKLAERRVLIDSNKNPLGLGALISQPWMYPVWMWDRSPLAKSLTARAMYHGAEQIPATAARVGTGTAMSILGKPENR